MCSNLLSQRTPHTKTFFLLSLPSQAQANHSQPPYIKIDTQLPVTPDFLLSDHLNLYQPIQNHHIHNHLVHSTQTWLITIQFLTQLLTFTYIHPHMETHPLQLHYSSPSLQQLHTIDLGDTDNMMELHNKLWRSTLTQQQYNIPTCSLSCWLSQNLALPF